MFQYFKTVILVDSICLAHENVWLADERVLEGSRGFHRPASGGGYLGGQAGLGFLRESGEALRHGSGVSTGPERSLQMVGGKVPRLFILLYFPATPDFLIISFSSFV